jgi:hypothetical protein
METPITSPNKESKINVIGQEDYSECLLGP